MNQLEDAFKTKPRRIKGQLWYTPMQIARLGLIKNSKGDNSTVRGNYNFILELIHNDILYARNYSRGKKLNNWLVPETSIDAYHQGPQEAGK